VILKQSVMDAEVHPKGAGVTLTQIINNHLDETGF
jgi:hypothetical protein